MSKRGWWHSGRLRHLGRPVVHLGVDVDRVLAAPAGRDRLIPDSLEVGGLPAGPAAGDQEIATELEAEGFQVRIDSSRSLRLAGGIYNSKTLLASRALGASGFQIGSLLLGSAESALKDFEKERLRKVIEADIVLTKSFSGRFARGIKNTFIAAIEETEFILPYPYQNKLTNELRRVAKLNKNVEFVNIWVGQSINEFSGQSTAEIIIKLIKQTENNNH